MVPQTNREIQIVNDRLNTIDRRLESVDNTLKELGANLAKVLNSTTSVTKDIDILRDQYGGLVGSITEHEKRIKKVEKYITANSSIVKFVKWVLEFLGAGTVVFLIAALITS